MSMSVMCHAIRKLSADISAIRADIDTLKRASANSPTDRIAGDVSAVSKLVIAMSEELDQVKGTIDLVEGEVGQICNATNC